MGGKALWSTHYATLPQPPFPGLSEKIMLSKSTMSCARHAEPESITLLHLYTIRTHIFMCGVSCLEWSLFFYLILFSPMPYFTLNSAIYGCLYWRRLSIFMAFVWHADRQQEMTLDWLCWEMDPGRPGLVYYLAGRCSRLPEWLYASVCSRL